MSAETPLADIVALISERVPLRKLDSGEFSACCPFHKERTASFVVSQEKQFYHCFGCGAHGTAVGFLMQMDGLSMEQALAALRLKAH